MLEMIRIALELTSRRLGFASFISGEYPRGTGAFDEIMRTYDFVEKHFKNVYRESGEQYMRHLEATAVMVALVLKREGRRDHELVMAALLHDALEDVPGLTYEDLKSFFGYRVAHIVSVLSKKPREHFGGDKSLQEKEYQGRLECAARDEITVKLPDVLHNMVTLWAKTMEKQEKKIALAEDFYLPLARKHQILVWELQLAILHARMNLGARSYMKSWGLSP